MGTYDRQVALAERLIREKGKEVLLVSVTGTDATDPWDNGEPVETTVDAHAVFLNFNRQDLETISKLPSAPELSADARKVLIAAASAGAAPTLNDFVRDEEKDWQIVWVQVLSPSGQNILYTLGVQ